jgi:hypothetical protein
MFLSDWHLATTTQEHCYADKCASAATLDHLTLSAYAKSTRIYKQQQQQMSIKVSARMRILTFIRQQKLELWLDPVLKATVAAAIVTATTTKSRGNGPFLCSQAAPSQHEDEEDRMDPKVTILYLYDISTAAAGIQPCSSTLILVRPRWGPQSQRSVALVVLVCHWILWSKGQA